MNPAAILLGAAVVDLVLDDLARTVLTPGAGAGLLTRNVGRAVWSLPGRGRCVAGIADSGWSSDRDVLGR